ncbi:putative Late nodulin [Medicago truncatula]|uniref:Putative Late nodulin n=1 Tax=Medicago truncatula TaxID=3880 RepID=A0A396I6V7_MEDTR|nr:putative Late nodulin [Medicago truncatula]
MTKTLKFIYIMILFLSLFLVVESVFTGIPCKIDEDCPQLPRPGSSKSINYYCFAHQCFCYIQIG